MIYKQEAIDVMECYRRNMAHILGDADEKVKVIDTCINLVDELEDTKWTSLEELPKLTLNEICSERVLCIDSKGNYEVCSLWDDGVFRDCYGDDFMDVVKWMPIPKEEKDE